jgi:hypothetical protein
MLVFYFESIKLWNSFFVAAPENPSRLVFLFPGGFLRIKKKKKHPQFAHNLF